MSHTDVPTKDEKEDETEMSTTIQPNQVGPLVIIAKDLEAPEEPTKAPQYGNSIQQENYNPKKAKYKKRVIYLGRRQLSFLGLSLLLGIVVAFLSELLVIILNFITNICFFGELSIESRSASENHLGAWVIPLPVIGGLIVGWMSRYAPGIKGHGIPEAMESATHKNSQISLRIMFMKPLSAAITIGTGGPFGVEGPIVATGAAVGSFVGQIIPMTSRERRIFLCTGAAAGMSAIFGTPISAVLLAMELLLNEHELYALMLVGVGAVTSSILRIWYLGNESVFFEGTVHFQPTVIATLIYILIALVAGTVAAGITKALYLLEDGWKFLGDNKYFKIPSFLWPAIGAIPVGIIGYFEPEILGVGYDHIKALLEQKLDARDTGILFIAKLVAWIIYLSSKTSGGTLAPLFTIGSSVAICIAYGFNQVLPSSVGLDPSTSGLVGIVGVFGGCSGATLASIVFTIECTWQASALIPIALGGFLSLFVSRLLLKNSIMTEQIHRKGLKVVKEFSYDPLQVVTVGHTISKDDPVITIPASSRVEDLRNSQDIMAPPQPQLIYPVLNPDQTLHGLISRFFLDQLLSGKSGLTGMISQYDHIEEFDICLSDSSLREALNRMMLKDKMVLPVIASNKTSPQVFLGLITFDRIQQILKAKYQEMSQIEHVLNRPDLFARNTPPIVDLP